jgi:protoheme IX farnesyltransferase
MGLQAATLQIGTAWNHAKLCLELTKPRLTLMALATTFLGYAAGSARDVEFDILTALHVVVGSAMIGGGANALNQWLERDVDAKMKRTAGRPIPSGRLNERSALIFGLVISVVGLTYLFIFNGLLTFLFGATTLLGYALVYTPLKKVSILNTFVGAIAGALPILMGWSASGSALGLEAGVLFLILFVWQLPHFAAIAWVYREDYLRAGLKMFAGEDVSGLKTAQRIVVYSVLLFLSTLLPAATGKAGAVYFYPALLTGAIFVGFSCLVAARRLRYIKGYVAASIAYLGFILVFMLADKI